MKSYFFRKDRVNPIDAQIEAVMLEMTTLGVNGQNYPDMVTLLERLYDVKAKERPPIISRDTLVTVAGNLAGILLIVAYEQKHVMTSKGLNHLQRPK